MVVTTDVLDDPENHISTYRDFGELYGQNISWLTAFIHKKISNYSEAEDIAQDVFERLIRKKYHQHTHEPIVFQGNLRAFISTIAKGIIIDSWRKKELERKYLEYVADLQHQDAVDCCDDISEVVDAIFTLDQMLRALDDDIRHTFILSNLYGKTYAEIAQQLGINERKVKAYMAKAMLHCMKMRTRLDLDQLD